jgi:hypothetical protein
MSDLATIQAEIKNRLSAARETVAAPSARTISTRGKVFTLPTGQSSQGPISCIVLDWRNLFKLYTKPYNPQMPSPPECFALSARLNDMAPHELATKPASDSCAECTFNKFGSAPGGGRGKACKNTVRLAVIPADFMKTTGAETEAAFLNISPTGIRGWSAYVNGLVTADLLPMHVATEVSFDPNSAYPTLLFKAGKQHDDLELVWHIQQRAQAALDAAPVSDGD